MALRYKDLQAISDSQVEGWTPDGTPCLYTFARSTGRLSWIARVVAGGKRTNFTIGAWPDVKADTARAAAGAIRGLAKAGHGAQAIRNGLALTIEPIALAQIVNGERVSDTSPTPTFSEVATKWFNGISNDDYRRQVYQQLRDYALPALGERPVNALRRAEIVDAITPVWLGKQTVGIRLRGHIERILDYAVDREWCEFNVCPPVRSMPPKTRTIKHHVSLEPERAREFWQWLQSADMNPITRAAIALVLLSGKRTGEVRLMKWRHLDFERLIWTTPADEMKMRKAHRQPISSHLNAVFEGLRMFNDRYEYVLGQAPLSQTRMIYAIKEFEPDLTIHGLRATLGSWMSEQGVRKPVADHMLAHQPKALDAAYQRSDLLEERRDVLEKWGGYVTG